MRRGTNLEYTKSYNRRVVFEAIRLRGIISKAEIAKQTLLTFPTVSNITNKLIGDGLVTLGGHQTGGRGQPAITLKVRTSGAYSIGINMDKDLLTGVFIDLSGRILSTKHYCLNDSGPKYVFGLIREIFDDFKVSLGDEWDQCKGIGITYPGPVNYLRDTVEPSPRFKGWANFNLRAALREVSSLPVFIENNATAAAIGERWYGAGKKSSTYVFLLIGIGVGAGVIIDGYPYRGNNGVAGEVGHIPVADQGKRCGCGGQDCLELYASAFSLHKALGYTVGYNPEELERIVKKDEVLVADWVRSAASYLAKATVMIENLLDPSLILVGGHLPRSVLDSLVFETLKQHRVRRMRHKPRETTIQVAQAGEDAAALGAATLPFHNFLDPTQDLLYKAPEDVAI